MNNKKRKYIAVFVVKIHEVHSILAKRKISSSSRTVRFRKKTYIIDTTHPTYSKGLKLYYFMDIKDGQILLNEVTNESIINPEIVDMILARGIVAQLTANLGDTGFKMNLLTLLIGIALGGAFGFIIAGYL